MQQIKKHFVEFILSSGLREELTEPIDQWDSLKAKERFCQLRGKYGKAIVGFRFMTRDQMNGELDSHITDRSGTYWADGEIFSLEEIERNKPKSLLLENMKDNKLDRVVQVTSGAIYSMGENDSVWSTDKRYV